METYVTKKVSVVLRTQMADIQDTAVRIREKANELFRQYGLRSVSMDDIANALGISKKTIYQFYADKDELVNAFVKEIISSNQGFCDIDRNAAQNAIHEIFLAIDMVKELFRSMNPSLLFDMQKYYPHAFTMFSKHKNDYLYGLIRSNLERGKQEGLYRAEIDVEILSRFRIESIVLPFHPDFHAKLNTSLADIEEEITIHFLFGLVAPEGYTLTEKYRGERTKKILADAKK